MSNGSGTFNANARVQTLADAISQDPKLVAQVWSRQLRDGARSVDDFSHFEGAEKSRAPFVVKKDLSGVDAGDTVNFTVMSQPRGPGVRGEKELTGNTSLVNFKTFGCKVDYWRDAFELTKKQVKFMATGSSVKTAVMGELKKKLGRKRMNDMKMSLKLMGVGNTLYPNGRRSFASLTALDTMSPAAVTNFKPQWQRLGGAPFEIAKNKHGSPVYSCMLYMPDVAMVPIRNSSSYQTALIHAADRNSRNPMFTGQLLDWQGVGLFEHISVDPEFDVCADPLAARALLGVAFSVNSSAANCKLISDADDTKTMWFEFFGGHKYEWWEDQAADAAWSSFYSNITSAYYYAWIINPDGSMGFVKYQGSGNNGKQITLTAILNPDNANDASTLGATVVGNINCTGDSWGLNNAGNAFTRAPGGTGTGNTSNEFVYTSEFDAGAYIIPANANGAPDISSLLLGANSAVRCYASDDQMIHQDRDFGFVKGGGYETIYGQAPCKRTDDKTAGYALIRHTGQHPGLEVPTLS